MAHAGGRPTKYRGEKTLRLTRQYLVDCQDMIEIIGGDNKPHLKVNLPTMCGLARLLEVDDETLLTWARQNPKFHATIAALKQQQQQILLNKGLSGDYNSTIAKLILSNNHGYRERTEVDARIVEEQILISPEERKKLEAFINARKSEI